MFAKTKYNNGKTHNGCAPNMTFDWSYSSEKNRSFIPAADAVETPTHYLIQLTVPGMNKQDFKIEVIEKMLLVSGERKFSGQGDENTIHFVESRYGKFERRFSLPHNVDTAQIEAEYADGILTIRLPKIAPAANTTTRIEIK